YVSQTHIHRKSFMSPHESLALPLYHARCTVHSASPLLLFPQTLQRREVFQRRDVSGDGAGGGDLAEEPAHDLAGAGLRQRFGEADLVRLGDVADLATDMRSQLLLQLG